MNEDEPSAGFNAAAIRLLRGESQTSDVETMLDWLQLIVRRRYPSVDEDDIAQETLARVFKLATRERSEPIGNPAAYITRIAQHLALDALNQKSTVTPSSELVERSASSGLIHGTSDDDIAALLDRSATHATVAAALNMALKKRDHLVVRIVTVWLDLADELGHEPGSREVAAKANASHTTVNKALARFRELMTQVAED